MRKKIASSLAVFLFLIAISSVEATRWAAQIPLVYYDFSQKKEYGPLLQITEQIANRLAKCSGFSGVKIRIIDAEMANGFFSILAPLDHDSEATTVRRGIVDILFRNKIQFVINVDNLTFLIYKTIIAHEIAHQILEPTIYHAALNRIYFGSKHKEIMEDLADTTANDLLNKCESSG